MCRYRSILSKPTQDSDTLWEMKFSDFSLTLPDIIVILPDLIKNIKFAFAVCEFSYSGPLQHHFTTVILENLHFYIYIIVINDKIPWVFPDFCKIFPLLRLKVKIRWLLSDLGKWIHFLDLFPHHGNLASTCTYIVHYECAYEIMQMGECSTW